MNHLINEFAKVSNDLEKLARECAELTKKLLELENSHSSEEEADENEIASEFLAETTVRDIVALADIETTVDYRTSTNGVDVTIEAHVEDPSDIVERIVAKFIVWQRKQRKGGKNVL